MKFTIPHVGLNAGSEEEARHFVELLGRIFGLEQTAENPKGIFVGTVFEVMKGQGRGRCGHIAVKVDDVPAAMEELSARGIHFLPDTYKYDAEGNVTFAYFEEELAGFAFHLTK